MLRIRISHYCKEIIIPINKEYCNKIILIISKLKSKWKFETINIPEIGYQGMELYYDNDIKIFVYDERIMFSDGETIQLLFDPQKKVFFLLMKKIAKKYSKEMIYFFEVRKYRKSI